MGTFRVLMRRPTTLPPVYDWAQTVVANTQAEAIQSAYQSWVDTNPTPAVPPLNKCTVNVKQYAIQKPNKSFAMALEAVDPAQEAMQKLTAQWYNAVVGACNLDPTKFQLVQGCTPVGTTSEQLWNVLDVVPPASVVSYFDPSQNNVFSTDYGAVINNLVPQNSNQFQNDMGDYYAPWMAFLGTQTKITSFQDLFTTWAYQNMPPNLAQRCITDYQQIAQGTIPVAVNMWANATASANGAVAYNVTIGQLNNMLQSGKAVSFTMNSSTESSDLTNTWAKAEVGGIFDIFAGAANTNYSRMSSLMAAAGVQITASFNTLVTLPGGPLAKPSTDPILSKYVPWYSSAALNMAYQDPSNTVWQHGAPSWKDCFGPNGNMQRVATALIIVDGITITTSSEVGFSTVDQAAFSAAAEAGLWPFFEVSVSGGWSNTTTFDKNGNVTVTSTMPAGNPMILGVLVDSIADVL